MSFGFSVGDVLSITQLAWKTIQNSRKACGEHDDFTREVSSLHLVLQRLQQEIGRSESPLNRPNDNASKELLSIVEGCERVLKRVNTILKKHGGLREKENSSSKLWQKVRFGNGQVQELAQLRTKISYYVSALTLFLNMVSTGTMGRVEKKMDDAGGDLTEIRIAVNGITAHLISKNQQEGSVFTTYADDDKAVWREIRRELNQEGFSSAVIHDHKEIIKAYIKELASRGVLDDVDEPSDIGAGGMSTVSESDEPAESYTRAAPNIPSDSGKSYSSPLPTARPRHAPKAKSRAETMPKEPALTESEVESKPQRAFVETGSSDSEVDEGHINEVNPNSSRHRATDDDNDVGSRRRDSKVDPPQGDVPGSVNSKDLDRGLLLLSMGYDGRDFGKPPDSSESRLRCRSCCSRLSTTKSFVRLGCSHCWCYDCLKALIIPNPGGDRVSCSPLSLARRGNQGSRRDSSASDLSVSNWQAMRLKCCAAGPLDPSDIHEVLGLEMIELETECEEKKERSTSEFLQFCQGENCNQWAFYSSKTYTDGKFCVRCALQLSKELPPPQREVLETLKDPKVMSIESAGRLPTNVYLPQLLSWIRKPHRGIHDAIRTYQLGILPTWNTFNSDPPLSALAKAEYCKDLIDGLGVILVFLSSQIGNDSYERGLTKDLKANAQMLLAKVEAVEKTDECINFFGERRLIDNNRPSLWTGPDGYPYRPEQYCPSRRGPSLAPPPPLQEVDQEKGDQTPTEKLDLISDEFHRDHIPLCSQFIDHPPTDVKTRDIEYRKLSEGILSEIILKLDEVMTEGDPGLRAKRRQLVEETQVWLTKLDKIRFGRKGLRKRTRGRPE